MKNPKLNNPKLVYRVCNISGYKIYGIAYCLEKESESSQATFEWKTVKENNDLVKDHVFLEFTNPGPYEVYLQELGLTINDVL